MKYPYKQKTNSLSRDARLLDNQNLLDIESDIKEVSKRIDNVVVGASSKEIQANDARMDNDGVIFSSLKARIDADAMKVISAKRLSTATDSDKIKQVHLSDEVKQMIAGTTPINATPANGSLTTEKYATESVDSKALAIRAVSYPSMDFDAVGLKHLDLPFVYQEKGKNLFDKSKTTAGKFIYASNGNEAVNASFSVTHFIRISSNVDYVFNDNQQVAFYDRNKLYISGVEKDNTATPRTFTKFTTPANAYYVRFNMPTADLDKIQLERSTVPTKREDFKTSITTDQLNTAGQMSDLLMHLQNPFVKTKVKLIGSSSAAGVKGTGYSNTGETIMTDTNGVVRKANVETAYCWANNLKKILEREYNKYFYVDANHPAVKVYAFDSSYSSSSGSYTYRRLQFNNALNDYKLLDLEFYGTDITVLYYKALNAGKFAIYIDDVYQKTIDTSSTTTQHNVEETISGLTLGKHKLTLKGLTDKSPNSISTTVFIQGFKAKKYMEFKNWGISGTTSIYLADNLSNWVQSNDDFVLIQIGSNDRNSTSDDITRTLLTESTNKLKSQGKKVYLITFTPASVSNDSSLLNRMDVLIRRLHEVSVSTSVPIIDLYQDFLDYCFTTGKSVDSLLSDGLHSTDEGYDLQFRSIVRKLGIAVNRVDFNQ
ncbi:SGNH/GDSL hydrolase family protein [Priestia megaterium]|uniref:SGNH/GDSL hydrolase family protein n=1 Tax=Priestia megaterium TaxID=1404 RepID=UPI00203D6056|nr:SGNH/GDSL hydrolase family protein [Priestia megaterium]MCM3792513.1 SGNH/GDSL hydrolase family protein [Priestia megaterium]